HYMDEADRCHEIAYLAYGRLLEHGTIDEVIAKAGLRTYTLSGPDINELADEMTGKPGIDMVAPFGASLHVAGKNAEALDRAIDAYRNRPGLTVTPSEPSLEDAFISLMSGSEDNFP
ncbi:MAG: ABC transporter ATP-binding protein, partial [Hyphomicrobiaceae bacterium]